MNPAGMFNTTATLRTPSNTVQSDGSVTASFSTSSITCAVNPMSPREVIAYGKPSGTIMAKLYCGPSVTITQAHEVSWKGATWKVHGPPMNTAGKDEMQTVILERKA